MEADGSLRRTEISQPRQQRIFYGWIVTLASAVCYFLVGGSRQGGFSNFFRPISTEFGLSRAVTASAASLGSMEQLIQGPVLGYLIDRFGAKRVMLLGFVLGSAGFLLLSAANGLVLFYLVYVLMIPLGLGAVQLAGQTVVARWFIRKRSRALSYVTVGVATGGAVMTPLIGWMVVNHGWRLASVALGVIVGVVGLAVVSLIRETPEIYGLLPDGDTKVSGSQASGTQNGRQEVDFTTSQALRTRAFWLLSAGRSLTQLATSVVTIHTISLLIDRGVSPQSAANVLGITFVWGIFGRLFWGYLGDLLPKRHLLAVALLVQGFGILMLATTTSTMALQLFAFMYGVGQAAVPVQFAIRGEYFGRASFGSIAGWMAFFSAIGGVIGPIYAGRAFDATGSYQNALYTVVLACVVGAVLFAMARPPNLPKVVTSEPDPA